jgi:hypothetical protein
VPTQWPGNISISANYDRHLKWWRDNWSKDGPLIQIHHRKDYRLNNVEFRTCLLYSKGVGEHTDHQLPTPFSALLILYNRGFLVWQKGLDNMIQQPGTIVLLDIHQPHQLAKVDGRCTKWAAISIDYFDPLPRKIIESQLQNTYDRIFN